MPWIRGVFREGFWGSIPIPFLRNFFNLLGFSQKSQISKFSFPYKNISNPLPRKISGYTPGMDFSDIIISMHISQRI